MPKLKVLVIIKNNLRAKYATKNNFNLGIEKNASFYCVDRMVNGLLNVCAFLFRSAQNVRRSIVIPYNE